MFTRLLNSATIPQEPATTNIFSLSQLYIIFPTYCLIFVFIDLRVVSLSESQSSSKLSSLFANTLSLRCEIHKVMCENYYGILKLLSKE